MSIYEPCNYASNVAYYHTVTEICDHEGWSLPMEEGKHCQIRYNSLLYKTELTVYFNNMFNVGKVFEGKNNNLLGWSMPV